MRANAFVVIFGVVLVAVVAGCGGGTKKVSPDIWVPKVCSQVAKWNRPTQADATKIKNLNLQLSKPGIFPSSALKAARKQYVAALAGLISASTRFRAAMEELAPPNVKDGEKIQQDIDDALAKLAPALKKAKRQVASMRTDYPLSLEVRGNVRTGTEIIGSPANPKFMSDLAKFMNPFTSKFNNVYSPLLRAFKTPGLKPIVNKTPECQNFG